MRRPVQSASFDQFVAVREREPRPHGDRSSPVVPAGHELYVRGWVSVPDGATPGIRIDGGAPTSVSRGLPRPDVARVLGDEGAASAGFEVFVDTTMLAGGEHVIELVQSSAKGNIRTILRSTFTVGKPWPHTTLHWRPSGGNVHFDSIQLGDVALSPASRTGVVLPNQVVKVAGWAFNGVEMKAGIAAYAVIDANDAIRLRYGLDRNDVASVYGEEKLRYCGFYGAVVPGAYGAGIHSLRVVILMEDGSAVAAEDSLALRIA